MKTSPAIKNILIPACSTSRLSLAARTFQYSSSSYKVEYSDQILYDEYLDFYENLLFLIIKSLPKQPKITWKIEATHIAPCTSLIRICHSSVFSSKVIFPQPFVSKSSGHLNFGIARIANVGAKNVKVPPCTIGNLNNKKLIHASV